MRVSLPILGAVAMMFFARDGESQTAQDSLDVMTAFGKQVSVEAARYRYRHVGFSGSLYDEFLATASTPNEAQRSQRLVATALAAFGRPATIMHFARVFTPDIVAARVRIQSSLDRFYSLSSLHIAGDTASLALQRRTQFHDGRGSADLADAVYKFKKIGSDWRFVRVDVLLWSSLERDPGRRP